MTKFFKEEKKNYLWAILGPFCPDLGLNKFSEKKKPLPVFKYSDYLTPCQKLEKTNQPFLRKMRN